MSRGDSTAHIVVDLQADLTENSHGCLPGAGINDILENSEIRGFIMHGLATDYCVQATAPQAIEEGHSIVKE